MIPIAHPLASSKVLKKINKILKKQIEKKKAATGVKACQKRILAGEKGVMVLTADTTPMDLISHFPVLCEENDIKYVFVEKQEDLKNGVTCALLVMKEDDKKMKKLIESI